MANDSTSGGFLAPVSNKAPAWLDVSNGWSRGLWQDVPPLAGKTLYAFLQTVLSSISGLPGNLFFPRWQPEPPNLPECDWAAFGINRRVSSPFPYIAHDSAAGVDRMQRMETMECLVSFYGPNADRYSGMLRDGLYVPQNNEPFILTGFGLINVGDVMVLPSLVKNLWLQRFDLSFSISREINRSYPVLDLSGLQLRIQTSDGFVSTNVTLLP